MSWKEVLGFYKLELKNIADVLSVYESWSKRLMFEKLVCGPLYAIPTYAAMKNSRTMPIYTRTFWGARMKVILPEAGSLSIATTGFFEPQLSKIILRFVKAGMTFLDVGAHFGYYSLLASHLVGGNGAVHAFEPTPSTFSVLKSNVEYQGNVFANQVACHSHNDFVRLIDYGTRYSGFNTLVAPRLNMLRGNEVDVRSVTIDEYSSSRGIIPDFVKVDAESSEYEILRGMTQVIDRFHPMISLEVGDFVEQAQASRVLVQMLLDKGYTAYEPKDGRLKNHQLQTKYNYANLFFRQDECAQTF